MKKIHFTILQFVTIFLYLGFAGCGNDIDDQTSSPNEISGVKTLRINISENDYEILSNIRKEAIKNNLLETTDGFDGYVPVKISDSEKEVEGKIRLKGNTIISMRSQKWPFRVKLKEGQELFGMKNFSLHAPYEKNNLNEWFFQKFCEYNGIIALNYEIIQVYLNDQYLGVYALEEHFGKDRIGNKNEMNGIVVRFDEFWTNYNYLTPSIENTTDLEKQALTSSSISAYGVDSDNPASENYKNYQKAIGLLDSFRRGEKRTHEIFEVEKLAKFFAIIDLCGNNHAIANRNMKLFYDTTTSKFAPIPFDQRHIDNSKKLLGSCKQLKTVHDNKFEPVWEDLFFEDEVFFQIYVKELENISQQDLLDKFFNETKQKINELTGIIQKEVATYDFLESKEILYNNQKLIQRFLSPKYSLISYLFDCSGNKITFKCSNVHYLPLKINALFFNGKEIGKSTVEAIVQSKIIYRNLVYQLVEFNLSSTIGCNKSDVDKFEISYSVLGINQSLKATTGLWPYSENLTQNSNFNATSDLKQFKFISIDEKTKSIFFKPGVWDINKMVIIPSGYSVKAEPGSKYNILKKGGIISYSPIEFLGTEEKQIIFSSIEGGMGMIVLNCKEISNLEFVIFHKLNNPKLTNVSLDGVLNFYNSDFTILNCQITNNQSPLAIQAVESEFTISGCVIKDISADAFNFTNSTGAITNTIFMNCQGSGLVIEGSGIDLVNSTFNSVSNIAINVGKNGALKASKIRIAGSNMAVLSKDLSEIFILNSLIEKCITGIEAIQQSYQFGPASIAIAQTKINEVQNPFMADAVSRLMVDGKIYKTN